MRARSLTRVGVLRLAAAVAGMLCLTSAFAGQGFPIATNEYFGIHVVDAATGSGVPLVELETTDHRRFYTDNNGLVAFFEPGLMNQRVFFSVRSAGYAFPKDGFGYAGVALHVKPGGHATLKVKRLNIAERLYRITGAGCYRDTVLLGRTAPVRHPLLNAQVVGQDSVQVVPYHGRLYWFWGDTSRASYPLGNFHTTGATSALPGHGGLDPSVGINLTYFTNRDGFVKPMAPMPGKGMVWIDGLVTVPDAGGHERLVAHYSRMKSLATRLEQGLLIWNDAKKQFTKLVQFPNSDRWRCLRNHPIQVRVQGRTYFYILWPDRAVRVRADLADVEKPSAYEAFSCLTSTPASSHTQPHLDRDADGKLQWAWRTNGVLMTVATERKLIDRGAISPSEAHFQLHNVDTGHRIRIHTGTVNWNPYRKKWIMIGVQIHGTSFLGEVWYAEADSPVGPWHWAKKIVTHDHYSFYNPAQHPFFDQAGGRLIYFEGTYASTFSGNSHPTPRYDYNQILYRLNLADPRLRFGKAAEDSPKGVGQ